MEEHMSQKPSNAFIAASWIALLAGILAFIIGLWNASMELNEKGYYFTVLMFGLFAAISLQKAVRDQLEGIPVTNIYYGLAWFSYIARGRAAGRWLVERHTRTERKRLLCDVFHVKSFRCNRCSKKHAR